MVYLALTYDHRLVDGADAARFLTTVKDAPRGGRVRGATSACSLTGAPERSGVAGDRVAASVTGAAAYGQD